MSGQTIFRKVSKKHNFAIMDKAFLNDKSLSLEAKGLLAYLLTLPDDWKLFTAEIATHHKECRKAITRIMGELIQNGYLSKQTLREGNRIIGLEYTVYEEKQCFQANNQETQIEDPEKDTLLSINTKLSINNTNSYSFTASTAESTSVPATNQLHGKKKPLTPLPPLDHFETFWSLYPRKISKGDAIKAWKKIKHTPELDRKLLEAVRLQKTSGGRLCPDLNHGWKYVKMPSSWLNGQCWEDEESPIEDISPQEELAMTRELTEEEADAVYEKLGLNKKG